MSSLGWASISRPTMNFCRLPPDRLFAAAPGPPALTPKRSMMCAASARTAAKRQPAAAADAGVARQQGVVRQAHRRHRAAAQPLLGHEVQALAAPPARRLSRDVAAEQADRARRGTRVFAREHRHQLLLAVAGDAGDADDLAGTHVEIQVPQRGAEGVAPRQVQAAHDEHGFSGFGLAVLQLRRLGADHQTRQAGVVVFGRVELAGDPAAAQHGAALAQGADLVELVADVEDAAAVGGELAQGDEQALDGLRREHRSRLVEDQQLRAGQQRAHDLDPLALADRQRVHRALRVDVQTIGAGHLDDAPRDLGQRARTVESEPDVLGHGQRVEQAEVLVDHADAELARLRRAGHLHRRAVEAHLAGVGAHGAVDDLHQR